MARAFDAEVHATVKEAAVFLSRSRMTIMRRLASEELPSQKLRERGAREVRAIRWADLAEARYGPDHPPVMTERQLVSEAGRTGEAITAVLRPSGQWLTVGPGYSMAGIQDPPPDKVVAKLKMLEAAGHGLASAAARLQSEGVPDDERLELETFIRAQVRLAARLTDGPIATD